MWHKVRKILLVILTVELGWVAWDWCHRRVISSIGGMYFVNRVELPVPRFSQSDPLWKADLLGSTRSTLAAEGCAVTSAAMVLNFYGITANPKSLNQFLTQNQGYTDRGWIHWEKAAEFVPNKIEKAYENLPSYFLIDLNLLMRNPVIVRLRFPDRNHFVVIVGKEGFYYLIADPGGSGKGVYRLCDLTPHVEALRYYRWIN
jgi:hypothetical protein